MTARPLLPGMPLTPEHARQLEALVTTLTPEEALWISGYLASFARYRQQPESATAAGGTPELLILYGTETGHSAGLAERARDLALARGLSARRVDLAEFKPAEIQHARHVLLFTSTYGDGDPPANALEFCDYLQGRKAPRLDGMKFAVLGLGDSSYEHFCQTAKDLDHRFEALGARRLHPRIDCDIDYEREAEDWIASALAAFAVDMQAVPASGGLAAAAPVAAASTVRHGPKHPFPATILETLVLNGRGSDKETRHMELSLAGSGLAWAPGDALGVVAENDPALVEEVIARLGLKADEAVPGGEDEMPLFQALATSYEITTLTPRFIAAYGQAAGAETLIALARPERQSDLRTYIAGRQVIDVLAEFPARGLGAADFVAMLRPLQPRLYSIASSPAAYPEEAHLTVAVVRYASHGRERKGVSSNWLAEWRGIDDKVPAYVAANPNFRLPADDATPIVMVAAGTGIAPFRAFMQEREARGASGRNWLIFGDRRLRTDFLYQTEWQRLIKDGRLTRMDVAFSRDQEEKVYVQHRLLEHRREVHAWLQAGACLYVCGDASRLAPDVHAALAGIARQEGGMSRDDAENYLQRLQKEKRYQRDVY